MFHSTAIVETTDIGAGTRVWAYAHVLEGARIGANVNIGDHAYVEGGVVVGDNVTLKNSVCLWDGVTLENDVFVGPGAVFTNDRQPRSPRMEQARERYSQRSRWLAATVVRQGCSIGAAATICPGVELGAYSMIGAGAVVSRDVAPHSLMVGAPARRVADVCACGEKLAGPFAQSDCDSCGETGPQRVARLTALGQWPQPDGPKDAAEPPTDPGTRLRSASVASAVGAENAREAEAADNPAPKGAVPEGGGSQDAEPHCPAECDLDEAPIPLMDLVASSKRIKDEVLRRMSAVIDSAQYILGSEVAEFEEAFAAYCGVEHCVALANGTDALHLALRALEIGSGDEVITAGNSFAATPFAIAYTGARPVFVDVDPDDFNLDPTLVESAITDRTKAIIPVHLYGQPARMGELREIADRHGLKIVEDAAQAHGAEINGRRCGSFGDIGCFSFYPGKNLGAFGDGGAAVTNDPELARKLRLLRNYGQEVKNRHDLLGFNCRLDTLQACVLLTKLQHLERWTEQRRQVAAWYREELRGLDLRLPGQRSQSRHVYHLFVVRHPARDALLRQLAERKIFCGVHYPRPLSAAAPFRDAATIPFELPVCSQIAGEILSLPMYPELTRRQVARVADALRTHLAHHEAAVT